jgi:hypothetical protein
MKEMSLDKFINNVRTEVAKRFDLKTDAEIDAFFIGLEDSAKDNQEALEKRDKMLRDTVAELREAKRLLKAAVDDLNFESQCRNCKHKEYGLNTVCKECRGNKYKWRYADEALALIGEEGDTE